MMPGVHWKYWGEHFANYIILKTLVSSSLKWQQIYLPQKFTVKIKNNKITNIKKKFKYSKDYVKKKKQQQQPRGLR